MHVITLGSIGVSSGIPVNGMAGLTARVIADLDVTFKKFHSNVVIVSIIQEDAIVLCSGHLKETQTTLGCDKADFSSVLYLVFKMTTCLAFMS